MHRDLVEERGWISETKYKDGLASAQLARGASGCSIEHLSWLRSLSNIRRNVRRSCICVCFICDGSDIGIAYRLFGGVPWMQAIFLRYGRSSCRHYGHQQLQVVGENQLANSTSKLSGNIGYFGFFLL